MLWLDVHPYVYNMQVLCIYVGQGHIFTNKESSVAE